MKVLIVEDNELMRYTIRAVLTELGHEVAGEAEDGETAVRMYKEFKPDIVFLDLILPGRSGVDIMDDLRKIDPKARVVIVTALEQDEMDRKLFSKGAAAIIHKPFSYEEFRKVISRIMV